MKHTFYFKKEDIHERVYQITSEIANGRRTEEGKIVESMILHRAKDSLFDDFFETVTSGVFDTMSGYIKCDREVDSFEDEAYERDWFVQINMPETFNTKNIRSINTEIGNALVNGILTQWYQMHSLPDAELYDARYEQNKSNIRFKLCGRTKPIRRRFNSFP